MITSGIRLGSPAGTTRGFGSEEFRAIANMIVEVIDGIAARGDDGDPAIERNVQSRVLELCRRFPVYS
jgi:glycine hydroxymethyltransferase